MRASDAIGGMDGSKSGGREALPGVPENFQHWKGRAAPTIGPVAFPSKYIRIHPLLNFANAREEA